MTADSSCLQAVAAQPIRSEDFRAVFRRHPAGVAVVALTDGDRPLGFTATSVISVSAEPPILAFSIASTSSSWPALSRVPSLTVNFLAADQLDISVRFATSGIDRFKGLDWLRLPTGEPVITGVSSWIRGTIIQRTVVGSSFLVAVEATQSYRGDHVAPLIYHDRTYHRADERSAL